MPPSKQFLQFIALMELVETLAARQSTESLSLRNPSGESVGRLTVEGGQVRFGIEHRGRVVVDEVFMREQPRLSVILRKILDRHTLARAERDLTLDISAIGRVSLCELTARALRKVAADCVLPSPLLRPPDTGLPQLRLLNVTFSPLELTLGAGLWGNIRHDDAAVQLYFSPPLPTQERWLLEWQPNDPGFAWPILTDQLAIRRVADVRLFGSLSHLLVPNSSTRRLRGDRASTTASLVLFDEGICFLASSTRYLSLLLYDRTHIARLLTAYEEFIENDSTRRPETSGAVLLAGKVALAAGQHAASTMSGLRLASPGYGSASSQSAVPSGAAVPGSAAVGDSGRPGERRSTVSLRPVTAPAGSAAVPRPVGTPAPVAAKPPAAPIPAVSTPTVPAGPAATSTTAVPPHASEQTPPAAAASTVNTASAGTPPLPADAWTSAGATPAPSAVTIAPSNTSAILALAGGGLDGSGAPRSDDTPPLVAKSTAKAGAGQGSAAAPSPARRASSTNPSLSTDDWLLAASELVDSSHWHAPQTVGSSTSPKGTQTASPPATAAAKSPPTSVVTPDAGVPSSPRGVAPPAELVTSALLAATLELGQILPLVPAPQDGAAEPGSERTPRASGPAAVVIAPPAEPPVLAAGASPPTAAIAGQLSVSTAAASASTPVVVHEADWQPVQVVFGGTAAGVGDDIASTPAAAVAASPLRPVETILPAPSGPQGLAQSGPLHGPDASEDGVVRAASAETPAQQDGAPQSAALPESTVDAFAASGAIRLFPNTEAAEPAWPEPPVHPPAGVALSRPQPDAVLAVSPRADGQPGSRGDAVEGVVRLGFPDLALLAALPPAESVSTAGDSSVASLADSLALLSTVAAALPGAVTTQAVAGQAEDDVDAVLANRSTAAPSSHLDSTASPVQTFEGESQRSDAAAIANRPTPGQPGTREAPQESDVELDNLQFRLDDWSPVRSPARRDAADEASSDVLPVQAAEASPESPGAASPSVDRVLAGDAFEPVDSVVSVDSVEPVEPVEPVDSVASVDSVEPGDSQPAASDSGESIGAELDRLLDLNHSALLASREAADATASGGQPSADEEGTRSAILDDRAPEPRSEPASVAVPPGDLDRVDASASAPASASASAPAPASDVVDAEVDRALESLGQAEVVAGLAEPDANGETERPARAVEATVESTVESAVESNDEAQTSELATPVPAVEPVEPAAPPVAQRAAGVTVPSSRIDQDEGDASQAVLSLEHFTARVDGRTVLKDVTFSLDRRGVYAIMGPGGSGKSSLLGILGGTNRQTGGWTFTGTCLYEGRPLGDGPRPTTIPQLLHRTTLPISDYLRSGATDPVSDAQLLSMLNRVRLSRLGEFLHTEAHRIQPPLGDGEWWRLVTARALMRNPPLLGIDEPTAGLSDVEAALILDVLKAEGLRRTVVFVTHNQQHARVISHRMMLLAGGRLQECETTEVFFCGPKSRAGQDYVRTGGCYVPSPDSPNEALSDEFQAGPVLPPITPTEPAAEAVPPPVVVPPPVPVLQETEILWAMPPETVGSAALSLRHFGLRVGTRTILHELSFDLSPRGLFVLSVPDGMAKRMLVRALCGPRPANFHTTGQTRYGRAELSDDNSPSTPQAGAQLLMMSVAGYLGSGLAERSLSRPEQRAESIRLISEAGFPELLPRLEIDMTSVEPAERRVLEILRAAASLPAVLVVDEPLSGLPPDQRERVISVLHQQAKQRAVLILSQDATVAAELKAMHGWLRDGRTTTQAPPPPEPEPEPTPPPVAAQPEVPVAAVQADPAPSPPANSGDQAAAADPQVRRFSGRGPRGFQWLRLGALAGMPAPGLANDLAYDLDLIRSTGLSCLVTLTHDPLPAEEVARHGLRSLQFPIVDMDVPTEEAAARLCAHVAELVAAGQAVGFHCKAGLGRTGTMLACQLIWEGTSAAAALQQVRSVEPGWIQSEKQVVFLGRFEEWLRQMWPMEGGQRKKT